MKSNSNFRAKRPLLTLSLLLLTAHGVKAQDRLTPPSPNKKSADLKPILGSDSQELVKRYGKPTAICVLPDSPPNKLHMPDAVPQLLSSATPKWAQSASFSLQGRKGAMVWLYKRDDKAVAYLIDGLGFVEAGCVAASEKPTFPKNSEFEVSPLPSIALGEAPQNVLERYGYPAHIRSTAPKSTEFVYLAKTQTKGYEDAFATVFTIRDNQVVRVYSYAYMPKPSERVPSDRLPSDPSKGGRYYLLKPA
jgi:hypothetical protein